MKKLLAFAVFIIFISCSKEQDTTTALPASGTILRYVKGASGGVQSEFIHDDAGKIVTRNSFSGETLFGQAQIHYKNGRAHLLDQKMDVSSAMFAPNYVYSRIEFIYHNDRIIQTNHFVRENERAAPVLRSFSVFDYNAGLLVKQTRFLDDGTPLGFTDYSYDLAGNIILSESYHRNASGEMQQTQKIVYQHDNHSNPYLTVYLQVENIPFSINKNNITKAISTDYSQGVSATSNTSYENFNLYQFPLSMVEENNNRFTFEYN